MTWDEVHAKIEQIRGLGDDWDGEGAPAFSKETIASAILAAEKISNDGHELPHRIVAGINGSIYFEWFTPKYREVEIT